LSAGEGGLRDALGGEHGCVWAKLWEHDPNGLVAVDPEMRVRIVNPAFCRMFRTSADEAIGSDVSRYFGDMSGFATVWEARIVHRVEREFPDFGFFARQLMFAIPSENIVACIMIDLTEEWRHECDMVKLQRETIEKVNEVVDNQMKVAQEIAGLLGETTAETKVSLLKLVGMIERGNETGG
jgi:transcriptional regulator of aromatic amino acid metabolism